jgi:lipopolysaccharide transport system ATP-binding protein
MSETVIRVDKLSKRYRIGRREVTNDTFIGTMLDQVRRPIRNLRRLRRLTQFGSDQDDTSEPSADVIWALRDVTLNVVRGEVVGIIGQNGAGKSTLLKILSRITPPTSGEVDIHGRVSSLLEVGTGFHPELTGRENVYLNGTILGMRKTEIDRKFDEILAFSGVEKFIDTPVKRYSSGMRVRLAFSVAAHLEPEILLVDEVLAVGDAEFQRKSLGKMGEVARQGRTVLFVSHQLDMIRSLCDRCVLLKRGRIEADGPPEEIITRYLETLDVVDETSSFEAEPDDSISIQILRGQLTDIDGNLCSNFDVHDPIFVKLVYTVRKPIAAAILNIEVKRNESTLFLSFDSDTDPTRLELRSAGTFSSTIQLPDALFKPGRYTLTARTGIANSTTYQLLEDAFSFEVELRSKPSAFLSYSANRPGWVATSLDWMTQQISDKAAVDALE